MEFGPQIGQRCVEGDDDDVDSVIAVTATRDEEGCRLEFLLDGSLENQVGIFTTNIDFGSEDDGRPCGVDLKPCFLKLNLCEIDDTRLQLAFGVGLCCRTLGGDGEQNHDDGNSELHSGLVSANVSCIEWRLKRHQQNSPNMRIKL